MAWPIEPIVPNTYPTQTDALPTGQIIADASNVYVGDNPAYTTSDFLATYPGFTGKVPDPIVDMYLKLAHSSVKQARFGEAWEVCIGLFLAHFLHLYLRSTTTADATAAKVLTAGEAKGLRTNKGVGSVSVSIDYQTVSQDLDGWAEWKSTDYGRQYATLAKFIGMGGMGVY